MTLFSVRHCEEHFATKQSMDYFVFSYIIISMNLYSISRPLLFALPPECAHTVALQGLSLLHRLHLLSLCFAPPTPTAPVRLLGLTFPNRVGVAAGLDKNGAYTQALAALGFGFIEVGTVTPRPQVGNPKPRLFRLPKDKALRNRMGFNNDGVVALCKRLESQPRLACPLGINIGKQAETSLERAHEDYVYNFERVYSLADYVVVNVSSPNTQDLRRLQEEQYLARLFAVLKKEQSRLEARYGRFVPLFVKVSPNLSDEAIANLAAQVTGHGFEGVVATNTRPVPEGGGLSGAPIFAESTRVLRLLRSLLPSSVVLIGVGGISTPEDAQAKLAAGADLLQVYTGLIYKGPGLLREICG